MNRFILLGVLILAFTATGTAATNSTEDALLQGDLKSLSLGDEVRVTATLVNRLPVQDTIRLTIEGSAMTGIIDASIIDTPPAVTCSGPNNVECFVTVDPKTRKDVNLTVEATAMGQGVLSGTANSSITNLASSDQLDVNVGPRYGKQFFSAPGITFTHVILIALMAGTVLLLRRE